MTPAQIAAVRRRAGMSQRQFAEHLGVSSSTVKSWESGRTSPTGANLAKVLSAEDLPAATPSGMRRPASMMKPNLPPEAIELKTLRLGHQLTIREVVAVAEVAERTLQNYESGLHVPSKVQMIGLRVCIEEAGRLKRHRVRRGSAPATNS